jgi:hypothetical protein
VSDFELHFKKKNSTFCYLELRQAFDLFDTDNSGGISISELKQALCALGVNVTDQEARQMFSAIDIDSKETYMTHNLHLFFSFPRKWFVIKKITDILFFPFIFL